ncbi:hypothetical protein [Planctomycetes bacterium TBK1r]|uniref:Uncharacterized protein n=1 Tax=Stieleria magnilauensis TaxID=2527963 RepID=A0ABX5Y4T6_9BACT|nr:hypothetical protein TBK1r_75700 [Planctomycetes bacterium TBK1r]
MTKTTYRIEDATARPVFVIRCRADHQVIDELRTLRGLRWLLKRLGRNYGLRVVSIQTERHEPTSPMEDN